jgi:hypothetical protein
MTIYFYSAREEPYGCFSNFSHHGFELEGLWWKTSEHYFQSQKFVGTIYLAKICQLSSPGEAAKMGRDRTLPLREDWEEVKDNVMKKALLAKFFTHKNLGDLLISTQNELIVENSPIDYYWGCGKDGSGKNRLGELLMEVRDILSEREPEDL